MEFRLASRGDLPALRAMYGEVVARMRAQGLEIWDDVYPVDFLREDVDAARMYVCVLNGKLAAAFSLMLGNRGDDQISWPTPTLRAAYMDRLAVAPAFRGRGLGGKALGTAVRIAAKRDVGALRLFVAEENLPAIRLYERLGFTRVPGVYEERFEDGTSLKEIAYEYKISR